MSLDKRSTSILTQLINADSYVPVKELTDKYNKSRRTIYYDIEKINGWLEENHIPPVQQIRGEGFYLEDYAKRLIPDKISTLKAWHYEYSVKERKAWLAIYLMTREQPFFLEDLMEKIRVSRNTTIEDLKALKDELTRFDLLLEFDRKLGYVIRGKENDKRKAIVFYLSQILPDQGWQSLIGKVQMMLANPENDEVENKIQIFKTDYLHAIYSVISECEKELNIRFTDDILHSLTFRLLLFGRRLSQGKNVEIDPVEKEVLQATKEFQAAIKISHELSRILKIDVPEDEVFYITTHLLSARVNFSEKLFQEESDDLKEVISKMVTDFQKYACVVLPERDVVEKNLLMHIKPAFYRVKYGLEVENLMADSIKEKYYDIFNLTKMVIHHLENAVGKPINDDEIAFIAMHFGGWLKREGLKPIIRKKALLVCTTGIGTSRMLEHQLEGLFSTVDIIGSVSLREYEEQEFDADFVISTTPIQHKKHPVFIVHPILSEAEKEGLLKKVNGLLETDTRNPSSIEGLIDIIKKHAEINNLQNLEQDIKQYLYQPKQGFKAKNKPDLHELLKEEYIQLAEAVTDWKEAIRLAAQPLLQSEAITEEYITAMIDNVIKTGPYIVVAPKVAIPHAKPEDGVKKLGMSLLRLNQGISFSESKKHQVQLVIVLAAIDRDKHLKSLSQLTTMFSNQQNIERVISAQHINQITELISEYSAK
jgi:mannitol operon transcriptional antiterminator